MNNSICEKCGQTFFSDKQGTLCISCLNKKLKKEELERKIQEYCDNNAQELFWDYRDGLSKDQILTIIEKGIDGISDVVNDIYENNLDYFFQLENDFKTVDIFENFQGEITEYLIEIESYTQEEIDNTDIIQDFIHNDLDIYPIVNINVQELINRTGDILAMLVFYSNYDCTVSYDTLQDGKETYLYQIWDLVRKGIRKDDFLYEHNHVYGGSLFTIPFEISLNDFINMKEQIKRSKNITIPKDTEFGFFSDFQGSGSPFDKKTYRNMTLPINFGNSEYDHISLKADIENHYTMKDDVYGFSSGAFPEINFPLS